MVPATTSKPQMSSGHIGSSRYSVPALPLDNLRRQRLLDFLHTNIRRKLNLVCAAAGYGKSSLLIDFAHDADYPVAWCRLVEADGDLAMLATSLTTAMQVVFPEAEFTLPRVAAQPGVTPDELAAAWTHELDSCVPDYFVLVLDDFHTVQNVPSIIRFFDVLLADLPEQVHLLIAGRVIPPLRIAALAARQEIAGLNEEHLRFTPAEVQQLLQLRNGVLLPPGEAEELIAGTEGWITGILLTTHLMWQALMANLIRARQSESPVYEYLAGEVFNQQPPALQRFLLESAVLPEMEPPQCDAVLDRSDSAQWLQQAEANRLFITVVGDESLVYQYHHLFRDFLIARLRDQDPNRLRTLQQRAGEWYATHQMPEAAVTFFVLANQMPLAAQVAEANAQAMVSAGRRTTLERWAEQLVSIKNDIPTVHLYLTSMEIDTGNLDRAEQALAIAAAGFEQQGRPEGLLSVENQRALLLYRRSEYDRALIQARHAVDLARTLQRPVSAATGLRYLGSCHFALGQLELAEQALLEAVQLFQATPNRYDLASTYTDMAMVLYARGETARATRAQQQALAIWREMATPGPLAVALNNIGWNMHMLGQYQSALTVYDEALDWARRAGGSRWEATIQAGRADVLADLHDYVTAADLYRQASANAERINDQGLLSYAYRGLARLDRLDQNYLGALEWLRRAREVSSRPSPFGNLDALQGLLLIDLGRTAEGRSILKAACADLERSGTLIGLAQALLFRAYAEFRSNEFEAAAQSLAQACATAERVGHDQMLVSEALGVRGMLDTMTSRPDIGRRVAALLSRAEAVRALRTPSSAANAALRLVEVITSPVTLPRIEVRAFGPGQALRNGVLLSAADWGRSAIGRELFFYALECAPQSKDQIGVMFWPDLSPGRMTSAFHAAKYRIRRALGVEFLIFDTENYRINPAADIWYDVAEFRRLLDAARRREPDDPERLTELERAVALYTGDYLCNAYSNWAVEKRQLLQVRFFAALQRLVNDLIGRRQFERALEHSLRGLDHDYYREELHRAVMRCLSGAGHPADALAHYAAASQRLTVELGTPLEQATINLADRIRSTLSD